MTTAQRRAAVTYLRSSYPVSERRACRLVRLSRSRWQYRSRRRSDAALADALRRKAEDRPRWGYRYGGWGAGAGVVGAIAAGAIIAGATRPAYGYGYYAAPAPVSSCDLVERFDRWGNVIGYRRVCGYY